MILIVEDNKDVNNMLAEALSEAGYETESVFNGIEGIHRIKEEQYQLVLLDIMLPFMSGDEILREMRNFSDAPVIVISAKDMVGTKIDMLKLGADDYITKPFDLGEVVARVETNLRRTRKKQKEKMIFQHKDLKLDEEAKIVTLGEVTVDLTAKEYKILEMMMKNPGKVYTKANLYESVWEDEYLGDENAVKTHMSNLRNKLKKINPQDEYIETVWGLGYRMDMNK